MVECDGAAGPLSRRGRHPGSRYDAVKLVLGKQAGHVTEFILPVSMFKLFTTLAHHLDAGACHDALGDDITADSQVDSKKDEHDEAVEDVLNLTLSSALVLTRSFEDQDRSASRILTVNLEHESDETFSDVVLWLFRDPDFHIKTDNLDNLMRICLEYRVRPLFNELEIFVNQTAPSFELYLVSINQDIAWLETKHRDWVFDNFDTFVAQGHLHKLSPDRASKLIELFVTEAKKRSSHDSSRPQHRLSEMELEIHVLRDAMMKLKTWMMTLITPATETVWSKKDGPISVWERAMQEPWQ